MITADVDRDISTANCWPSLGDEVDRVRVIHKLFCSAVIGVSLDQIPPRSRLSCCYVSLSRHSGCWAFDSTVPIDVVRLKSYVVAFFTLCVYKWGSRFISFTFSQSARYSVTRVCSETFNGGLLFFSGLIILEENL